MYEHFYGFRERPFDLTPNPRYLVLTDSHREALSNLEYGIASKKGITLLIGEAGSGKTTVIRTAIERQPGRVHCVYLHNPTLSRAEFVEMLAARFNLSERAARSKTAMLIEFETLLMERKALGETTVLVVDEAQSLPLDLLEEIRLLANIETASEKLVSVIIAGQPELVDRLNEQALRQFKQRVALRCELRSLTLPETITYIAGRIRAAGGIDAQVFTREAVMLMHERAHGLPRLISVIADNALLGGFAAGERPVGVRVVREVCRDFDLAPAPIAPSGGVRPARPSEGFGGPSGIDRPKQMRGPNGSTVVGTWREEDRQARLLPVEQLPQPPVRDDRSETAARGGLFAGFSAKRKRFSFFGN